MDGLIIDTVLQGLFIQEVKEVFDSWRHDGPGAEDATEEVVDELLQRSLKRATKNVRSTSICPESQCYHCVSCRFLAFPTVTEANLTEASLCLSQTIS